MQFLLLIIFFFILFGKEDNESIFDGKLPLITFCYHAFEIKKQTHNKYTNKTWVSGVDYKTP